MLVMSKPLGVATTKSYYRSEFTAAENASYYTEKGELQGQWHGMLAEEFGLQGAVTEAEYERLVMGQDPRSGLQLVAHRDTIKTKSGEEIAHRSAWDLTVSAPKSVSAAALVAGDERVRAAHEESVKAMLDHIQQYVQARMGGNNPAQTTGNFAVAMFQHDAARPVGGGAPDPQLHTHVVMFNMTKAEDGQIRSLQTRELMRVQSLGTAIYRAELAMRLQKLGYEIEIQDKYVPQIKGYSKEYLESISQRRSEIEAKMAERGVSSAESAEIITKQTRANKQVWDPDELRQQWREQAQKFGSEPKVAFQTAQARSFEPLVESIRDSKVQESIAHARESLSEREAVFDRAEVLKSSLQLGLGKFALADVEKKLDERVKSGEFVEVSHYRANAPGARYTTPELIQAERETIAYVANSQNIVEPIYGHISERALQQMHPTLTSDQNRTIREVLEAQDKVIGVQGGAGTGKSFALQTVRDIAQGQGYEVRGIAPTSSAVQNLSKDGIESETLQAHLARGERTADVMGPEGLEQSKPVLYLLDESSLASTKQVREMFQRLGPEDRVVLIGDIRQHQSVEAGRIFEELQQAGMKTSRMDEIVRQQNPELKAAIEDFAKGEMKAGLQKLADLDKIQEIEHRSRRFEAIAREYAAEGGTKIVISPDNESRQEINRAVRNQLQQDGIVSRQGFEQSVLVLRQDLTSADRKRAESYHPGEIIRFEKASKALGIERKTYAEMLAVDAERNLITIQTSDGFRKTYDPKRFYGVQIYELERRQFSVGDRVQFTSPWKAEHIANRQLGTIVSLEPNGNAAVTLDGQNRTVEFNLNRMNHLDYGYATTSYSSQSLTVDRSFLNIETADPNARSLLGRELAYVATSRARYEVKIFTDNADRLGVVLDRKHEKGMALSPEQIQAAGAKREQKYEQKIDYGMAMSF